jgi:hypothetical protein
MERVNMWWAQTMDPMMEMEYMAMVIPRGEKMGLEREEEMEREIMPKAGMIKM